MLYLFASMLDYSTRRVPLVELEHEAIVAKVASQVIAEAAYVNNPIRRIILSNTTPVFIVTTIVPASEGHRDGSTSVREKSDEILTHGSGAKLRIERSIVDKSCKRLFKQVLVNQPIACPMQSWSIALKIKWFDVHQVPALPAQREQTSSKCGATTLFWYCVYDRNGTPQADRTLAATPSGSNTRMVVQMLNATTPSGLNTSLVKPAQETVPPPCGGLNAMVTSSTWYRTRWGLIRRTEGSDVSRYVSGRSQPEFRAIDGSVQPTTEIPGMENWICNTFSYFCVTMCYIAMARPTSIEKQVLAHIQERGRGAVFTPHDFRAIGSRGAVAIALHRLTKQGTIRRLGNGLYDYPAQSDLIGALSAPAAEIAAALAKRDKVKLHPTGALAANMLGLSEQVPMRIVYLTTGRSRKVVLPANRPGARDREIELRHSSARFLDTRTEIGGLVIQALRHIGRKHFGEREYRILSERLPKQAKLDLLQDLTPAPAWIADVMRRLANEAR